MRTKAVAVSLRPAEDTGPHGVLWIFPRVIECERKEDRRLVVTYKDGERTFEPDQWDAVIKAPNKRKLYRRIGDVKLNLPSS